MQPVEARLIPYARRNAFQNMAIDEYMISWHVRHRRPVLRVYGWDPPAVSLGRYQRIDCLNREACGVRGVDIVRRVTGGGAIFHDQELTYSLACGAAGLGESFQSVKASFERINAFILEMYRMMGLNAVYAKTVRGRTGSGNRVEFCFSGNEEYDIIIKGMKIGGNAQRRIGSVIFQHGSIPLRIDADGMRAFFNTVIDERNFTTLDAVSGTCNRAEYVADTLIRAFTETTGYSLVEEEIGAAEQETINEIMNEKYRRESWNWTGRVHEYEVSKAGMAR
jgi:lipoate-protein ligase A